MSLAYYKVIQISRLHRQQIQATTTSQRVPEIDVARYKNRCIPISSLCVFFSRYLPVLVFLSGFYHSLDNDHGVEVAFKFSALLVFLSCSLNLLIVLWRKRDFRNAIREMPRCLVASCKEQRSGADWQHPTESTSILNVVVYLRAAKHSVWH